MPLHPRTLALLAVPMLTLAGATRADSLDSLLDGMYVNTTSPSVYHSQTRGGIVGGSIVARAPIRSVNLLSVDPPRINAGCGGIDMYMGSFSYINSDQIVATLRAVGQNAKGLLFQMALEAINSFLGSKITHFMDAMQKMNQSLRNTCEIAQKTLSVTKDFFNDPKKTATEAGKAIGTNLGTFEDSASAWFNEFTKPDAATQLGNPASLSPAALREASQNPAIGNLAWRAFFRSGAADRIGDANSPVTGFNGSNSNRKVIELLMNLTGTLVVSTSEVANLGNDGQPVCGGKSSGSGNVSCTQDARPETARLVNLDNLMNPDGLDLNGCGSPNLDLETELGCQDIVRKPMSGLFGGTDRLVNKMLFGIDNASISEAEIDGATDGILYRLTHNQALTQPQLNFLSNIHIPLLRFLVKVQRDPAAVRKVAQDSARIISQDMAIRMAKAMVTAAESAWNGKDVKVNKPDFVDGNIESFRREIMQKEGTFTERTHIVLALNTYTTEIYQGLPTASFIRTSPLRVGGGR